MRHVSLTNHLLSQTYLPLLLLHSGLSFRRSRQTLQSAWESLHPDCHALYMQPWDFECDLLTGDSWSQSMTPPAPLKAFLLEIGRLYDGFLTRISVSQFGAFLRIVGPSYFFLSLSIRAVFRKPERLQERLIFLETLLRHASNEITDRDVHAATPYWLHHQCIRSKYKTTFMALAIATGDKEVIRMVWEVYYKRDTERLEQSISHHLADLLFCYHLPVSTLISALEYLMDEWNVPPDSFLHTRCATDSLGYQPIHPSYDPWQTNGITTATALMLWPPYINICRPATICPEIWTIDPIRSKPQTDGFTTIESHYDDHTVPLSIFRFLVRRGADLTGPHNLILQLTRPLIIRDSWKHTIPLGPKGALRMLLEAGVDPEPFAQMYKISLLHCFQNFKDDLELYRLLLRCSRGSVNFASRFGVNELLEEGDDGDGWAEVEPHPLGVERLTPLQHLLVSLVLRQVEQEDVESRWVPFVEALMEFGAHPHVRDGENGRSAVMIAAADGARMAKVLEVMVGQEEARLWAMGWRGEMEKIEVLRPLLEAVESGVMEITESVDNAGEVRDGGTLDREVQYGGQVSRSLVDSRGHYSGSVALIRSLTYLVIRMILPVMGTLGALTGNHQVAGRIKPVSTRALRPRKRQKSQTQSASVARPKEPAVKPKMQKPPIEENSTTPEGKAGPVASDEPEDQIVAPSPIPVGKFPAINTEREQVADLRHKAETMDYDDKTHVKDFTCDLVKFLEHNLDSDQVSRNRIVVKLEEESAPRAVGLRHLFNLAADQLALEARSQTWSGMCDEYGTPDRAMAALQSLLPMDATMFKGRTIPDGKKLGTIISLACRNGLVRQQGNSAALRATRAQITKDINGVENVDQKVECQLIFRFVDGLIARNAWEGCTYLG
ncbi:hypothetical protein BJ508DRAFT_377917 [Ascobolus immersus RN42]|uniref:Ankyrin n=1 Tax=Ascobolus immersus RN42 TaxID=1160509 RepID=A0A3N4HZK0_ASCIM|nr:hypothetical protein BJ508DRAFT_377917 [Ascobolus immersus RN42]